MSPVTLYAEPSQLERLDSMPRRRKIIYLAAPYTQGDVAQNVRRAILAADVMVVVKGWVPFIPHLTHFWHMISSHPIEFWYEYDMHFLEFCDALLRLDGDSVGADREVEKAKSLNMPIYYSLESVPKLC